MTRYTYEVVVESECDMTATIESALRHCGVSKADVWLLTKENLPDASEPTLPLE
jgi:hypothetical protein